METDKKEDWDKDVPEREDDVGLSRSVELKVF